MVKRLAAMAIAALWMAEASAEAQFGVTVYPGARADAAVTRDLKDKLKVNGFAYRTGDSVAKVAEYYRKQPPLKELPGASKESAAFGHGPVMVTIQNPWIFLAASWLCAGRAGAQSPRPPVDPPAGPGEAAIDLATVEGMALVKGQWRNSDTKIVEVALKGPGPRLQPTGEPLRTYDVTPRAGGAEFDDSSWAAIDPTALAARRSTGRLCFNWYRIQLTIPERVGEFETRGSSVVFETSLDDYAEIWVDGELPRRAGQSGGSMVKRCNAANRLVSARDVRRGHKCLR